MIIRQMFLKRTTYLFIVVAVAFTLLLCGVVFPKVSDFLKALGYYQNDLLCDVVYLSKVPKDDSLSVSDMTYYLKMNDDDSLSILVAALSCGLTDDIGHGHVANSVLKDIKGNVPGENEIAISEGYAAQYNLEIGGTVYGYRKGDISIFKISGIINDSYDFSGDSPRIIRNLIISGNTDAQCKEYIAFVNYDDDGYYSKVLVTKRGMRLSLTFDVIFYSVLILIAFLSISFVSLVVMKDTDVCFVSMVSNGWTARRARLSIILKNVILSFAVFLLSAISCIFGLASALYITSASIMLFVFTTVFETVVYSGRFRK